MPVSGMGWVGSLGVCQCGTLSAGSGFALQRVQVADRSLCPIIPAWGVQQLHLSVSGCWKVNRVYTLTQHVTTAESLCGCSVGSWWWFSSLNFQSCGSYTVQANIVHLVYMCLTVRWHHLKYSSQGGAVVSTASSHHGGCRMFCAVPVWVLSGWNCQWMSSFKLSVLIFAKKATNLPNADKPTALFHWIIFHLTVDILNWISSDFNSFITTYAQAQPFYSVHMSVFMMTFIFIVFKSHITEQTKACYVIKWSDVR